MNDPERPPLDDRAFEEIKAAIHNVDERHWPVLIEMQVPNYCPPNKPVPPQRPIYFRDTVVAYALDLFEREADFYASSHADPRYPPWLSRLADRTLKKVLEALDKIEQGNAKATLWYHGVTQPQIFEEVRNRLWHATNQYMQAASPQVRRNAVEAEPSPLPEKRKPAAQPRMPSTIESPSAARKMEAYIAAKGIGLTDFASTAGTTDRTLRNFRKTGKVRRGILAGIASAMGTSKEELLK